MKVRVSRSRNACSHYVTKGFRNPETGRPTTKVVERLGNEEAIRARISGKLEPVLQEAVDPLKRLAVLPLPVKVVLPGIVVP